ncbi:MAG TPA: SPOR domain-containing protein [Alphaproteobacteria bacterium]|nr:SPOR domain-containing protein [Alphaproteobacteria bacterium]
MGDLMMRWLKLSLVALVACGFIGMVVYALWMRDEIRSAQVEPALISPPDTAIKRRPDEPGGMAIPNRDKLVFDLLDEASTGVSAPAPAPVAGSVAELPLAGAATPTMVVTVTTAATASPSAIPAIAPAAMPMPAAAPVENAKVAAPTQPVAVAETKPEPKPEPKAEPKAKSGGWGVQLAAVGSQADAAKMAASLQSKNAPLKGLTIVTPDAGNGRWRVQFFGIANKAAAAKVCSELGSKQPCFPVANK